MVGLGFMLLGIQITICALGWGLFTRLDRVIELLESEYEPDDDDGEREPAPATSERLSLVSLRRSA